MLTSMCWHDKFTSIPAPLLITAPSKRLSVPAPSFIASGGGRHSPAIAARTSRHEEAAGAAASYGASAAPPVFLTDTERMLLVSFMDVDPYAPSQTLVPGSMPAWLAQRMGCPGT